ncbi:MAG: oligoendopeptidase F [Chlamydiales bacterium]|nr:oligoendopeptidase F [Chlamydiia bacterium]MCP5508183.1 oligoendopeptidase F [Chlamydiales bacterium]
MILCREEVEDTHCWAVDKMYPTFTDWEKELKQTTLNGTDARWNSLMQYQGKLGDGPETVKAFFDELFGVDRKLTNLYTYAHLRHDEDLANDAHKSGYIRVTSILHDFAQAVSWVEPELLALPEETINSYLQNDILNDYRFHLEKIVRIKKHTLPPLQEQLLAMSAKALQGTQRAFSAINDADFKFGKVKDGEGKERELTHAAYGSYMRDYDRTLRENSFTQYHGKYKEYANTLCELLNGTVQGHLFQARSRHYSSCLEAALFPKNIDLSVYRSLITAVSDNLTPLHKYFSVRERILGIKPLHLYDMGVPLTKEFDMRISYDEAARLIVESVAPLGEDYQKILKKGLTEQRWVDRYENSNKRSGAYSSGCYDSMPYILMNYKEMIRDLMTLAHEAGHSMHSQLSHMNQPYQYANYPIFLAEVASTFNEELLIKLLLERANSAEEKIYLINQKIEDIRGTLFRQTMFAEFELFIHEMAEQDVPLTPKLLSDHYVALNKKYFGDTVAIDEPIAIEWARVPHFYYNFYVYQYATGISAALALADNVLKGGNEERDAYLGFLKSGCSRYPIETLKLAGVDMTTSAPVEAAIGKFSALVDELDSLM